MTKLKVSAISKNELELLEDGKKGDIIDLNEITNVDTSSVIDAINKGELDTYNQELLKAQSEWDQKIQSEIERIKLETEIQFKDQLNQKEKDLNKLQNELKNKDDNFKNKEQLAKQELEKQIELKNAEIEKIKLETESQFKDQLSQKQIELSELQNELKSKEQESQLQISKEKEKSEAVIKLLNDQLAQAKDFKAKQSTKEIGESLEQYAANEFNKIRSCAFPNAYFEKDNQISKTNSKGDFIFRNFEDETEFISIMFDMKNEMDTTATKHKNADFFKELDKDRKEKNTEYAILVSLLEADSDLYNTGIVQVHEYEKMYVVRPQFFISIIGILNNAARNTLGYKKELAIVQNQNIDITNFENELNLFKDDFAKTSKNFNGNLEKLDKNLEDSIKKLTNARDELRKAMNNLEVADKKIESVNIKKLTKNNPTMQQKFDELK
ncbi:MAG: DUF2130 domain-containing protein [Lactobacillaceae bacterium]|jgi:hypothetical protein|nr:DUF2130 domain-containing protein [Lactobacillaceae bacterium]